MTKSRGILKRIRWTAEDFAILDREYPDTPTGIIATLLERPLHTVYQAARRRGLSKSEAFKASEASGRMLKGGVHRGEATRFKPGQISHNAGIRSPGYAPGRMAESQFKKGQRSSNWLPVGSTRINADGYLDVKVTDSGYPPRDWKGVHRLVWQEANGPIPRGHVVVFRKGRATTDPAAITVDALELLTRIELMKRNSYHNRYPKEIGLAIQLKGALTRQINRRERGEE
jgi:hypothetical protein